MKIETFEMERWQSVWENRVEYNLSESGVQPIPLRELLRDPAAVERFLSHPLAYSQGSGTPELRSILASMYAGATPDHVLVTNGTSEANFLVTWHLVEPGDEVVMMVPNYMGIWGAGRHFGATLKPLRLREPLGWQFDPEELKALVTKRTKAIAVCNPNNPTGAVMDAEHRRAVLDAAADVGAWLMSDEVYQGAEREGPRTESLFGRYEKTIVTNGLSKAYGLPGLRIGWAVAPPDTIEALWAHHDYLTLTPTYLGDRLAQIALEPTRREEIYARTRSIVRRNYGIVRAWLEDRGSLFSHVPPRAGAICYVHYALPIRSLDLAQRLLKEKSVLIVPGEQFGMEGYFRIGMGDAPDYLTKGLDRIDELLRELKAAKGRG